MLLWDGVLPCWEDLYRRWVRFWRGDCDLGVGLARGVGARGRAGARRGTRGVGEGEGEPLALGHTTATVLEDVVWQSRLKGETGE